MPAFEGVSGSYRKIRRRLSRVARGGRLASRVGARRGEAGVRAENVVWIFGSGRTGSTWLAAMMNEMENQTVWREPLIGALFGNLYYDRAGRLVGKPGEHYILGEAYKETWMGPMRDMVLAGGAARFPWLRGGGYLVIKEPNGSIGAPLLMRALPESRMILLVRDPRDVVASSMDARREGGWLRERRQNRVEKAEKNPDAFVRTRARLYLQNVGNARQAYEAHGGRKALVRYEDLRADPLGTMKGLYSALEIPVDGKQLARAVEKHSWENIPEEEKGEGKFYRKARPGGWREDLTPEQARIVEEVTGPLLREFYPGELG